MVKQDVRPTLLFGAGIWGYHKLAYADPMTHPLQKPYSVLQRVVLGQPHGTAHWSVTLMTGLMPIQHWILRDFCRLWNRLRLVCDENALVAQCMRAQQQLLHSRHICWLKRWHDALEKLMPEANLHSCLVNAERIDEEDLLSALKSHYLHVLRRMGNPFDPACPHRKIAFTWHLLSCQYPWLRAPRVVTLHLPHHIRLTWLRMLAGNAHVPARHYTHVRMEPDYCNRICTKCLLEEVADESHILFRCSATASVRTSYRSQFLWTGSLQTFIHNNRSGWSELPVFVHHALSLYQSALDVDDMTLLQRRALLRQRG
jgi:hypothetical protein